MGHMSFLLYRRNGIRQNGIRRNGVEDLVSYILGFLELLCDSCYGLHNHTVQSVLLALVCYLVHVCSIKGSVQLYVHQDLSMCVNSIVIFPHRM